MALTRRSILAAGAAGAVLAGCSPMKKMTGWVKSEPWRPEDYSARLKTVLDDLAVAMLKELPERATSLAVSESQAGGYYKNRLGDHSPRACSDERW